ncbi:lanthionine synthetase LanC family protein [Streptomyces albus]
MSQHALTHAGARAVALRLAVAALELWTERARCAAAQRPPDLLGGSLQVPGPSGEAGRGRPVEFPSDPGVPVLARLVAAMGDTEAANVAARACAVWARGAGRGPGHRGLYDGGLAGTLVGLRQGAVLHPALHPVADRLRERLLDQPNGALRGRAEPGPSGPRPAGPGPARPGRPGAGAAPRPAGPPGPARPRAGGDGRPAAPGAGDRYAAPGAGDRPFPSGATDQSRPANGRTAPSGSGGLPLSGNGGPAPSGNVGPSPSGAGEQASSGSGRVASSGDGEPSRAGYGRPAPSGSGGPASSRSGGPASSRNGRPGAAGSGGPASNGAGSATPPGARPTPPQAAGPGAGRPAGGGDGHPAPPVENVAGRRGAGLALVGDVRYGAVRFPDYDLILGPSGLLLAFVVDDTVRGTEGEGYARYAAQLAQLCGEEGLPGLRAHYPDHPLLGWLHGRINTGMGHGVAGVVAALSAVVRRLGPRADLVDALRHACHWLRRESFDDARDIRTWAGCGLDGERRPPGAHARQAWCYGTPGVSWALREAGEALGDRDLADWAGAAFTSFAEGFHEGFHLFGDDPGDRLGLCHGAAGVLAVADAVRRCGGPPAGAVLVERMLSHLVAHEEELWQLARERCGLLGGAGGVLAAMLTATGGDRSWLPCLGLR